MEKEKESRSEALTQWILAQIEKTGPVPFSQFMEWCLYHPEFGYYRSEGTKTGKDGDYFTSPCVHPLFGAMVAKQLCQMAEILGKREFHVVEMGGGRGLLCLDILNWTKKKNPSFFRHLKYFLLETNPHFIKEQRERLHSYETEGKVLWMNPETLEMRKNYFTGCILSNELVDAFPVHRVVLDNNTLKELYVGQHKGKLKEVLSEPSDPRLVTYLKSMNITLQEGQSAEVNLKALEWMENVALFLNKGFVLTIDYGYLADELYASQRLHGTFLCYYRHQTSDNPFQRLGEQDMTSHINFTALIKKGEEMGLQLTGLVPQYRFLIALGILQEMEVLNQETSQFDGLRSRLSLLNLIEPEVGMGEIFKVLIQHKGIDKPMLDGLRDLENIPWPPPSSVLHISS